MLQVGGWGEREKGDKGLVDREGVLTIIESVFSSVGYMDDFAQIVWDVQEGGVVHPPPGPNGPDPALQAQMNGVDPPLKWTVKRNDAGALCVEFNNFRGKVKEAIKAFDDLWTVYYSDKPQFDFGDGYVICLNVRRIGWDGVSREIIGNVSRLVTWPADLFFDGIRSSLGRNDPQMYRKARWWDTTVDGMPFNEQQTYHFHAGLKQIKRDAFTVRVSDIRSTRRGVIMDHRYWKVHGPSIRFRTDIAVTFTEAQSAVKDMWERMDKTARPKLCYIAVEAWATRDGRQYFVAFKYKRILNDEYFNDDKWHTQKYSDPDFLSVWGNINWETTKFDMRIKVITEKQFVPLCIPVADTLFDYQQIVDTDNVINIENQEDDDLGSQVSSYPTDMSRVSDAEKRLSLLLIA